MKQNIENVFQSFHFRFKVHRLCPSVFNNFRGVAKGGVSGGARVPAPRNLTDHLTLFKPEGADYAPHTTASHIGFKIISTPLILEHTLILI